MKFLWIFFCLFSSICAGNVGYYSQLFHLFITVSMKMSQVIKEEGWNQVKSKTKAKAQAKAKAVAMKEQVPEKKQIWKKYYIECTRL